MRTMRTKMLLLATVLLGSSFFALAGGGAEGTGVEPATAAKVRASVENYVKQEQALKGGFFLREAQREGVRDLVFDYVHEGVKKTANGQFFVCVDFLDQDRKRLDVDFYLLPTDPGELKVTKIKVHKVDGVESKEK